MDGRWTFNCRLIRLKNEKKHSLAFNGGLLKRRGVGVGGGGGGVSYILKHRSRLIVFVQNAKNGSETVKVQSTFLYI